VYARRAQEVETHVHIFGLPTERPPNTLERDAADAEAAASNPSPPPLLRLIIITTRAITEIKGRGRRREAAGTTESSPFFFTDLPQAAGAFIERRIVSCSRNTAASRAFAAARVRLLSERGRDNHHHPRSPPPPPVPPPLHHHHHHH
jgi:hypothetical protein